MKKQDRAKFDLKYGYIRSFAIVQMAIFDVCVTNAKVYYRLLVIVMKDRIYFDDISLVFYPNELNFFSKYSPFKALQNVLFLFSKIISIISRYVIQSISPRRTTFKENLLTNLSNRSFHLDDESIFRCDSIPINSMSKFIPD